ncbi:GtrA family protein [Paraburkholderia sp. J10-1]|uniref:GtrA family protein n=1 Tax=Paraburkholderia sp. J10-1 TaxID=2805430 RepID=UPI002AB5E804|nr:GtrA family protein [Paraburkholderia sp. J10-1]
MTELKQTMRSAFFSRSFLLFLLTGGFAAAVNWSSRILYNIWMPFSAAIVVAYITGMIVAYVLAKIFVFKGSTQSTHRSVFFFVVVNLIAILQTWAVSIVLTYYVFPAMGLQWHAREVAHAFGVAVPVFTSYLGHKHWTFQRR